MQSWALLAVDNIGFDCGDGKVPMMAEHSAAYLLSTEAAKDVVDVPQSSTGLAHSR
jgi:hypothetical protein